MMDNNVMFYLDRMLREICSNDILFGGKVVIFGGDWKQLTVVVENGGKYEQLNASIKNTKLFRENFKTLRYVLSYNAVIKFYKLFN
jgi:hypothetical protein